ncbi:hypothetical protein AMET1_0524 [Methanonatronarchaeum thermophilum]|uniref:Uncharacterized protein n=1 Tax=Methanonatronarchaeum thermophilum TaxID=1927129 RepID=A0A1Y3GEZ5_9EURY|nr:hypothetical protein [Methanonatronarchaeum thermophilum]OUJ18873.1 hypothetical protein AMET1_0524 [Methanonatronarchaeum thermophilum]
MTEKTIKAIPDSELQKIILTHPDTLTKAKSLQILCERKKITTQQLKQKLKQPKHKQTQTKTKKEAAHG